MDVHGAPSGYPPTPAAKLLSDESSLGRRFHFFCPLFLSVIVAPRWQLVFSEFNVLGPSASGVNQMHVCRRNIHSRAPNNVFSSFIIHVALGRNDTTAAKLN